MFIPYLADVSMKRWPIANFALIGVTTIVTIAMFYADEHSPFWDYLLLQPNDFKFLQLFGCTLIHIGPVHLLGNMLFLWVFGNAIDAKFGHGWFLLFYFAAAAAEGLVYVLFGDYPALGASGAIMGVVGAFLVLYPRNVIRVFWMIYFKWGAGTISAMWLIAIYIAFDIWGLVRASAGVAYISHVTGAAFGIAVAVLLLKLNYVQSDRNEENLLQVLGWAGHNVEQEEAFGLRRWREPNTITPEQANTPTAAIGTRRPPRQRDQGPIPLD